MRYAHEGGREKIRNGRKPCPEGMHQWGDQQGEVELQDSPIGKKDFEAFLAAKRLWNGRMNFG